MSPDPRALAALFAHETLGAPENAVGFVLWRVIHRYTREIDRTLAPLDLTHLQFTVLALAAWMGRSEEVVTQAGLARFGDIHAMQVSQLLRALEVKGLVSRPRSAVDTRAKQIALTEAGIAALRNSMPLVIAVQQRLFGEAGNPGGPLLTALLRIEERAAEPVVRGHDTERHDTERHDTEPDAA